MKVKLTTEQKLTKLYNKSNNQKLLDSLIERYVSQTKSTVENLLNVCETLRELDDSVKDLILNETDLNYFCEKVGLNKSGSTYRKYVCIGKKVDLLRQYIDTIPSSVSTIYELCTLDPEKFEQLFQWKLISHTTTLHDLKEISGKSSTSVSSKSLNDNFLKIEFNFDTLSNISRNELIKFFDKISSNSEFKIICPITSKLVQSSNNVIDIQVTEVEGVY
jgi:ferritin-like metal-binding protein YciE